MTTGIGRGVLAVDTGTQLLPPGFSGTCIIESRWNEGGLAIGQPPFYLDNRVPAKHLRQVS